MTWISALDGFCPKTRIIPLTWALVTLPVSSQNLSPSWIKILLLVKSHWPSIMITLVLWLTAGRHLDIVRPIQWVISQPSFTCSWWKQMFVEAIITNIQNAKCPDLEVFPSPWIYSPSTAILGRKSMWLLQVCTETDNLKEGTLVEYFRSPVTVSLQN